MIQKSIYDNLVLCKIKNGEIIVSPEEGKIFGKIVGSHGRKEIGSDTLKTS